MAKFIVPIWIWLARLIEFLLKITLCMVLCMVYEAYWFNASFVPEGSSQTLGRKISGYLWLLNTFKNEEKDIAKAQEAAWKPYTLQKRLLFNCISVLLVWVARQWGVLRSDSFMGALKESTMLFLVLYFSQIPSCILSGSLWQPHVHQIFLTFFVLFTCNIVMCLKPGRLFTNRSSPKDNHQKVADDNNDTQTQTDGMRLKSE